MNLESILDGNSVPFEIKEIILKEIGDIRDISQKYRELFERSPTLNVLIDLFGNIIDCNDIIEDITGIPKEQVIGNHFTKTGVVTEEDISQYMELLENILEGPKNKYLNVKVIHKNGTPHYLNLYPRILMKNDTAYAIQVVGTDITDFKNKERELQLWKDCIDSSMTGIGLSDLEGKILYVNEASVKMWGYENEEEIIGKKVLDFWEGDGIYETLRELREVGWRTGEDLGRKKDGTIFDVQFFAQIIKDETGQSMHIFGSFIDISEKKQTEEALIQSEERYRSFVQNFQGIAFKGVMDFTPIFFHGNVEEITGYTEFEFAQGKLKWNELIHPSDFQNLYNRSEKLRTVPHYSLDREYRIIKKNGQVSWVFERIQNVVDNTGKIDKVQGVIFDISYQKHVETALHKSEEQYRMLIEKMEEGVLLEDSDGYIKFVNPRTEWMLDYPKDELIGKHWSTIIPKEELEKTRIESLKRSKGVGSVYESKLATKRGNHIPVIVTVTPIFSSENEFEGTLAVFTDLTEYKKLEKEKEEFNKRQNEFINQTTHEIKTPLTIIQGFIEFLLKQEGDTKKTSMFEVILRNCKRLENLSEGVGDIYKLEREEFKVYLSEIDFRRFLNTALEPYFHLYPDQINFDAEDQKPLLVNGDPSRLLSVLNNVLDNSIKNTPKEKRYINIVLKRINNQLQLDISDNGAGIESINLKKVFDKFVSFPTIYDVRGTGIGLYLSREVINAHNGTITICSDGLGKGTTVSITLPLIVH